LAWHFNLIGKLDEAERYGLQALDMRIALFGEVHPRVVSTMGELGDIYFDQGKWAQAEATATRALAISEQVFEPGNRFIAYQRFFVARARHATGDLQGARELYAEVIEEGKRALGPDHPVVARRLKAYARCLLDLGVYQQAEAGLRDAIAILEQNADGPSSRLEEAETLLADTLLRSGRLSEAEQLLGPDPAVGDSEERQLLRARLALIQGDAVRAEKATVALLQKLASTQGPHLPLLPQVLHLNGQAQIATGRAAPEDSLLRAMAIYAGSWSENYWRRDLVRVDLGVALVNNGDLEGGRSHLVESVAGLERKLGLDHPETRRAVSLLEAFEST
jgi:tetratricopeptide (TPR) repeat protein